MRLSIAFARSIFIAIPNERQVKSFADDLIMQRGGVSTRGVLLLRCTEPQPLLLDLENKSPPLPKRSRVTPPPRTNPPTRTLPHTNCPARTPHTYQGFSRLPAKEKRSRVIRPPFAAQLNAHGSSNKRSRVIHGPCAPGSFWRCPNPARREKKSETLTGHY